jgi:IS30 family transposase
MPSVPYQSAPTRRLSATKKLAEDVYVAEPASPWQRGTNENTNGSLRQYFPKRTNLSLHTPADLQRVEDRLNQRPRNILGWQTPAQVFFAGPRS